MTIPIKAIIILFFTFLCFLLPKNISAQKKSDAPLRVEIEADMYADNFNIIPIGKEGLILFSESEEKTQSGLKKWVFTFYNTNFKEIKKQELNVPKSLEFLRYTLDATSNNIFVLFGNYSAKKGSKFTAYGEEYIIVKLDIKSKGAISITGMFPQTCQITDLKASNDIVYIGGYDVPSNTDVFFRQCLCYLGLGIPSLFDILMYIPKPMLIVADFKTNKVESVIMKYEGSAVVSTLNTNYHKNVDVLLSNKISKEKVMLNVCEYNGTNLLNIIQLNSDGKNEIENGKLLTLNENEKLLVGTYSLTSKNSKYSIFPGEHANTSSQGIYISKIDSNVQSYIKFHSFTKFKNFFNYLNDRSQRRMENQIVRKKRKGKEISFDYNLLIHDVIKQGKNYIIVAEAYFPEYHTDCYTTYTSQGIPNTYCYQVFDGYRYTHAIVAGFNNDGELMWDNSFEIWDVLTFNLKERVKLLFEDNKIVMVYSYDGAIRSKVISENKVIDEKDVTTIETSYKTDKVKDDYNSDIDFWYDSYFIAYGYQKIKNEDRKNSGKRTVFYFNKIAFN